MPQKVFANGGLSSTGAVWCILQIQELALSYRRAAACREPFLIGNLPKRLLPHCFARVASQRSLHGLWPVPRVYAVRRVGMGSRSLHGRRGMATWVTSVCGDVHDDASPARSVRPTSRRRHTWRWSTHD